MQAPLSVTGGETYTICFDAKADAPKEVQFNIESGRTFQSLTNKYPVPITVQRTYKRFSESVLIVKTEDKARLVLNLGDDKTSIQIDNIGVYLSLIHI